jgi:hypothetical protein
MTAVIAHDEGGTDVLDRPGRREAAGVAQPAAAIVSAAGSGAQAFSSCRQANLRSMKPFAQRLGITGGRQF